MTCRVPNYPVNGHCRARSIRGHWDSGSPTRPRSLLMGSLQGFPGMKLARLEPATSWVRSNP